MNARDTSPRRGSSPGARFLITSILFLLAHGAAFAQPFVYERSFGTEGTGPGQFQQITALAQDSQGNYVILDRDAGEFQVCSGLGICTQHETAARIAGEHGDQWGLALNSRDEIFITNDNGPVEKCTLDGQCEIFLSDYDGLTVYSWGIAIDSLDRVYIGDGNYGRIIVCDRDGGCSAFGTWGGDLGHFNNPYALAIDAWGRLLVADSGHQRIQACDHLGNCEYTNYSNSFYYGGYGQGMTLLPSGTMVTTGWGAVQLSACTPGALCRIIAQYDYVNPNYLLSPMGVMVNDAGRLVVGDYGAVHFLAPKVTINPGINDAWIEPALPGQGLLVSVFEQAHQLFIAWFTYESTRPEGLPEPEIGEWGHRWITLQGGYSGRLAELEIFLTEGGVFESASPPPGDAIRIGEATLTLHDCYHATLTYSIDGTGYQRSKDLVRIVNDNVSDCEVMSGLD